MKITPEQELLFTAIRLDTGAEARLHTLLLRNDLNWPVLEALAIEHNVAALLYRRLKDVPGQLFPQAVAQRFQALTYTLVERAQRMAALLIEIVDVFQKHGLQVVPFKGPALAIQAYGDLALRQYADVDLLVREADFRQAHDLIVSIGFIPEMVIQPAQDRWLLRSGYDVHFHRGKDLVELHWAISERSNGYPLKAERLWEGLCSVPVLGRPVQMLSPHNTVLMLCLHGSKHQWQKVKWIADLAYLLHHQQTFNWGRLIDLAGELGFLRMLQIGLSLSGQVLGLQIPDDIAHGFKADHQVEKLTAQIWERTLLNRQRMETIDNIIFYLRARERLRDRLYYIYDQALVPKQIDWINSRLPPSLYPVYYVLRPVRLGIKFGRQFFVSARTKKKTL